MSAMIPAELARDLLGSARMFLTSLSRVFEQEPLAEVTRGGLTTGQLRLLELVRLTGGLTIGELAAFLGVTPAAASQAVDRMVRRRYLKRSETGSDRRTSKVSLTAPGRRLLGAFEAARKHKMDSVLSRFTATELRRTTELLDRLSVELGSQCTHEGDVCLECGTHFRERCAVRGQRRRACFYERFRDRVTH